MDIKKIIILLFLLISSLFGVGQNWDIDIAKTINPQNPASDYWRITSGTTDLISVAIPAGILISGIIKQDAGLKNKSYEIFGAIVIDLVISEAIKLGINRSRPAEKYPNDIFPYSVLHGKSFPSRHTSLAFTTATSLSLQFRKWYIIVPAYMWAASVGYSRIYLGVHYPSDVLAGAVIGMGSAYLTHWLNKKLFKERGKG